MPHDANVGDMKLLGWLVGGGSCRFSLTFGGKRWGGGCMPRAVPEGSWLRIEKVKRLIGRLCEVSRCRLALGWRKKRRMLGTACSGTKRLVEPDDWWCAWVM